MNAAAMARQAKEKNPTAYCRDPGCLWRVKSRTGATIPCPRHPVQPAVPVTASVADATGAT